VVDTSSSGITSVFDVILGHIEAWGGDVVKFVGDALIVMWPAADDEDVTAALERAIECARELELQHGRFEIMVPTAARLSLADQIRRHLAGLYALADGAGAPPPPLQADADVQDRLRQALPVLSEEEVVLLAGGCTLTTCNEGEVIAEAGRPGDALLFVHGGEVRVAPGGGNGQCVFVREGGRIGEISALTGRANAATAIAARTCSLVRVTEAALRPLLERRPDLVETVVGGQLPCSGGGGGGEGCGGVAEPHSPVVTLRIHQASGLRGTVSRVGWAARA
jgi:hypothetical protein